MTDENFNRKRDAFLELLSTTPWFINVGQHVEGPEIHLAAWSDWPGPEDEGVIALHCGHQQLYDRLQIDAHSDKNSNWQRIVDAVLAQTSTFLGIDPVARDAWNPMSTACWQAGWTAALIAELATIREPLPAHIYIQWRWFGAGHWPAGYTDAHCKNLVVL